MAQKILSGVFRDPDGTAVPGITLTFTLKFTTSDSFYQRQTNVRTGADGDYSVSLYDGIYFVTSKEDKGQVIPLGTITILEDSPNGTLNDFLLVGNAQQTSAMLIAIQQAYQQMIEIQKKPSISVESFSAIPESASGWYLVESDETKGDIPVVYLFSEGSRYWFAMVEDV